MRRIHNRLKKGDKFWKLTVLEERITQSGKDWRSTRIRYICECDCGEVIEVEGYRIVAGYKKSCGCARSESSAKFAWKRVKYHDFGRKEYHSEYMCWIRMRRRCENSESQDYDGYGGRGIKVCDEWQDFSNFMKDMGKRPGKGFMIDRIDVNGNYEPSNCRWVTIKESNRNKRTARWLTIDGERKILPEWSDISGTNMETIRSRLNRGWGAKEAVFGEIKQKMERTGRRWCKRKKTVNPIRKVGFFR